MLLNLLIINLIALASCQSCGKTSPLVGKSGTFSQTQDGLSGSITIIDDCSFSAKLTINAGVPKIYFWGSSTKPDGSGARVSDIQLSVNGYQNSDITITLKSGTSWSNLKYLASATLTLVHLV